jgi:hypothetical protein
VTGLRGQKLSVENARRQFGGESVDGKEVIRLELGVIFQDLLL